MEPLRLRSFLAVQFGFMWGMIVGPAVGGTLAWLAGAEGGEPWLLAMIIGVGVAFALPSLRVRLDVDEHGVRIQNQFLAKSLRWDELDEVGTSSSPYFYFAVELVFIKLPDQPDAHRYFTLGHYGAAASINGGTRAKREKLMAILEQKSAEHGFELTVRLAENGRFD